MLTIKVLGSGCPNCQKVEEHVREAITWLKPTGGVEVVKVTDPVEISEYVLRTPGLVVNDQVMSEGRIPTSSEIVTWMADALS
jgi:small redox-active disulfide protein 2